MVRGSIELRAWVRSRCSRKQRGGPALPGMLARLGRYRKSLSPRPMDMTLDGLWQDLRYTLRTMRRDAGFCAVAVLILGLGIGPNTAIFSVVNALLFRPLSFRDPARIVWIANTGTGGLSGATTRVENFQDWRSMNQSFEDLGAYFAFFDYGSYNLIGVGEPE